MLYDMNFLTEFVKNNGYEKFVVDDYDKVKNTGEYSKNSSYRIGSNMQRDIDISSRQATVFFQCHIKTETEQ